VGLGDSDFRVLYLNDAQPAGVLAGFV